MVTSFYMGVHLPANQVQSKVLVLRYELVGPVQIRITGWQFCSFDKWLGFKSTYPLVDDPTFLVSDGIALYDTFGHIPKVRLDTEELLGDTLLFYVTEDSIKYSEMDSFELPNRETATRNDSDRPD